MKEEREGERKTKLLSRWVYSVFYLLIIAGNCNSTRYEGKKYINLKRTLRVIRWKFNSFICYILYLFAYTRSTTNYIVVRVWNIQYHCIASLYVYTFIIHFQLNKLRINIILYLLCRLFSISHVEILNYNSDRYKPRAGYIMINKSFGHHLQPEQHNKINIPIYI